MPTLQTEAAIAIASIRQIIDALEERLTHGNICEGDLEILASLDNQAKQASNWILLRASLSEPVSAIDPAELERELMLLVTRQKDY